MNRLLTLLAILLLPAALVAQADPFTTFAAAGTPATPRVPMTWNRYYDYAGITDFCKKLEEAWPNLVRLESAGRSYQGREIWVLTVTNTKTGDPGAKPGFYIDGNIHSNEIQGAEVGMYTAWYLTEMYGKNEFITRLLNEKTFYIAPTINPDGREDYMREPNNPHSPRAGVVPADDDGDGFVNEDDYDDLNGDGHVTQMRRRSPTGRYKPHPQYPQYLIPCAPDEPGQYELLGEEGLDNDGDGRVNEDGTGRYDPNRDWGWNWQPDYVQTGAWRYPFSLPENEAMRSFIMAHPNIAGAQSYHNSGGMILHGPTHEKDEPTYPDADRRVYDAIGDKGEEMLPGYKNMIIYKDLYSVYGGEVDFFSGGLGVFAFTNELWTPWYLNGTNNENKSGEWYNRDEASYEFNQNLLFGEGIVPWVTYQHPQYGEIEIGGFRKNFTRANPGFMLENDAHRNMAFTLYHAWQTPQLEWGTLVEKTLGKGLTELTVQVRNTRLIPTHSQHDLRNKITPPDILSITGAEVLVGMLVTNPDLNQTVEQSFDPQHLRIPNIPGMGTVTVRWIIRKKGHTALELRSPHGGTLSRTLN